MFPVDLYVSESVLKELEEALRHFQLKVELKPFAANKQNWIQESMSLVKKTANLTILIIPGEWIEKDRCALPLPINNAVCSGVLRFGIWGNPKTLTKGFSPFPAICIPKNSGKTLISAIFRHFFSACLPGVHWFFPEQAHIFSDRITSDKEAGRKLDQIIGYLEKHTPLAKVNNHAIRATITLCLNQAFQDQRNFDSTRLCPIALQFGVDPSLTAISIKWKNASPDYANAVQNAPLYQCIRVFCDAFWIQNIPGAKEIEALILYVNPEASLSKRIKESPPIGIDYYTNTRWKIFSKVLSDSMEPSNDKIIHEPLWKLPEPNVVISKDEDDSCDQAITLVRGSAQDNQTNTLVRGETPKQADHSPNKASPELSARLASLKSENEKLLKQFDYTKRQISQLNAKLSRAVETERMLENTQKTLEHAKAREADLLKKLNLAVEKIKELQKQLASNKAMGNLKKDAA